MVNFEDKKNSGKKTGGQNSKNYSIKKRIRARESAYNFQEEQTET